MLAFLIYFLMPLVWLFIASTKANEDLFSSFGLWFSDFNLIDNIREVFAKDGGEFADWVAQHDHVLRGQRRRRRAAVRHRRLRLRQVRVPGQERSCSGSCSAR